MVVTTLGVIAATAVAAAVAGGATSIAAAVSQGKQKGPDVPALPIAPVAEIGETAGEQRRKLNAQRASGTDNVLTGPLGVKETPNLKKTLLG